MMSRLYAPLVGAAIVVLAACSGGGGSAVPPGNTGTVLRPQVIVVSPTPTPSPSPTPWASAPPVSGSLYYAGADTVYAVPLNASGAVTASRWIKPHPKTSTIVAGIATNADGTLDILQNYWDANQVGHCQVVVEPADANQGVTTGTTYQCTSDTSTGYSGYSVARNKLGGFDLLYSSTAAEYVNRFSGDGSTLSNTLTSLRNSSWGFSLLGQTAFGAGHDYVENGGGHIRVYKASATSDSDVVADCTDGTTYGLYPVMAVAGDGTIYVVRKTSTSTPIDNMYIDAITACPTGGGAATVSRTIGPFKASYPTAMAVDSEGELYVALGATTSGSPPPAWINVYAPYANDWNGKKPATLRVINPSPTTTWIRALALYDTTNAATF